jgi:hypothetical protein
VSCYHPARYLGGEDPRCHAALVAVLRQLAAQGVKRVHIASHSMVRPPPLPLCLSPSPAAGWRDPAGRLGVSTPGGLQLLPSCADARRPPRAAQGARVVLGAVPVLEGEVARRAALPEIASVTLLNPDFELNTFVMDVGPRLRRLTKLVTIYGDPADQVRGGRRARRGARG